MSAQRHAAWLADQEAWKDLQRSKYLVARAQHAKDTMPFFLISLAAFLLWSGGVWFFSRYYGPPETVFPYGVAFILFMAFGVSGMIVCQCEF
jgi:hypothetical protein